MKKLTSAALGLTLTLALAAPLAAKEKPLPPGPHENYHARAATVIADVPFVAGKENRPRFLLDVYANPHDGLQPVVVMIHGGAWIKGDKTMDNYVYLCKALAEAGYVVFNVNYPLAPQAKIKTQAEVVMGAVVWVQEHARDYGGDPERLGVAGGSAGGHLGALAAWAGDDPWFSPVGAKAGADFPEVRAAALFFPVLELDRTLRDNGKFLAPLGRLLLVGSLGARYREAERHLSPTNYADASIPPTLFMTGDADSLHLYPQSAEWEKKLRELGADVSLYTAPGQDHGYNAEYWSPETQESVRRMIELFDRCLKN